MFKKVGELRKQRELENKVYEEELKVCREMTAKMK